MLTIFVCGLLLLCTNLVFAQVLPHCHAGRYTGAGRRHQRQVREPLRPGAQCVCVPYRDAATLPILQWIRQLRCYTGGRCDHPLVCPRSSALVSWRSDACNSPPSAAPRDCSRRPRLSPETAAHLDAYFADEVFLYEKALAIHHAQLAALPATV
jgi:hypothetical protein